MVPLKASEESRDMRFRVFEAAAPGNANSPSKAGRARGVLVCRWDKVDFLNDRLFRSGVSIWGMGDENEKAFAAPPSNDSRCSSSDDRGAGVWAKISKSAPSEAVPCKLLRFATGLPRPAVSKFMIPSLRLSGLDFAGIAAALRS